MIVLTDEKKTKKVISWSRTSYGVRMIKLVDRLDYSTVHVYCVSTQSFDVEVVDRPPPECGRIST
jgi:hypothetical protein